MRFCLISSALFMFVCSVSGLTTYECKDTTGTVVPVEITAPGHRVVITSPNYPDPFDLKRLSCKWSIKALHGATLRVQLVDSDLNDGCFDNILEVVDDTPSNGESPLKYPGKSAKCGQNDFGSIDQIYDTDAETVSVSFKSLSNNGSATFKLKVTASVPKACPAKSSTGCPEGPCCTGDDCCVINTGSQAKDISIPDGSRPGLDCQYKFIAPEGSQVAVNFLEMDIRADVNQACLTDYVMLQDPESSASSLIGEEGLTFCGQRLPNYPAPSIVASGGSTLILKYHTDESTTKKGNGFKAKVSAINPICNVMHFEQKYGDDICNSTCGTPYQPPTKNPPFIPTTTLRPAKTTKRRPSKKPKTSTKQISSCEEKDINYAGNDIECKKNSAQTWEECAKICNKNDKCTHWTWLSDVSSIKASWQHACCLKTSDKGRWKKKGMVSGPKKCGACEELDTDFAGNDIGSALKVTTWQQCSHICNERTDCSHWTWVDEDYTINPEIIHKCHLKNSDSGREKVTGLVSGTSECGEWFPEITTLPPPVLTNETCSSTGTKFISSEESTDLEDVPSWEQCANLCASIDVCSHWNWDSEDNQCSILNSEDGEEEAEGIISGTADCGKALPTTTPKTTPTTTEPLIEVITTPGRECDYVAMTIQVINGETAGPLPRATVKIRSKHFGKEQQTPAIEATHISDTNGEIVEIGSLFGTYNFDISKKDGEDVYETSVDKSIENATCTNEACTECSLHLKLKVDKITPPPVLKDCDCKGEVTLVNELTKLPVVGACVSFIITDPDSEVADKTIDVPIDAQTYSPEDIPTDSVANRLYNLVPLSRSVTPSNRDGSDCKNDWCKYEATNALFKYFETTTTWKDARETCLMFGAHLASIPSMNVNKFISERLPTADEGGYWIGGNKEDGEWVWGDRSPWNYANWAEGEPLGNNEDCVELLDDASFNDVSCESRRRFVCKKFDVPAPPSCKLKTNVDGKIEIDTNQVGKYVFTVTHEEYGTKELTTEVLDDQDGSCDECNIAVTFNVPKPFCNETINLKISVINCESKDPIEGAEVTTYIKGGSDPLLTITDEKGTTFVPITDNGDYTIKASASNMEPVSLIENVFCDLTECEKCQPAVRLDMCPPSPDSTIPPPDESCDEKVENSLTVVPVDKTNGKKIPTAEISIVYKDKYIAKDVGLTNSTYKTDITENGVYIVNGTSEGYKPKETSITTTCGSCIEKGIDLTGNDIKSILNVESFDECSELCKQDEECSHWTWVSEEYTINPAIVFKCHLKDSDSGRVMIPGLISGGEECEKSSCHSCINIVKLYLEPDVCEETDFTVKVYEAETRTPIEGAIVRITDVSDDSPQIISNHLTCPTSDIEPCGWDGITEKECGEKGCCSKAENSTHVCFKKIESKPMKTNAKGMIIAPSPGEAKLKIDVEKEGYKMLNGSADIFCQHPCDSCNPSFTGIVTKIFCEGKDVDLEVTVTDTDGNPIDKATVTKKLSTSETAEEMRTNEKGIISTPIYEGGKYTITVNVEGYVSKTEQVTIDDSDSCEKQKIPVEIKLRELPPDEDYCKISDISVFVFDETTKKGLPDAKVTIKLFDDIIASVETETTGSVIIPVSENGEYTITVLKKDFKDGSGTTTIQYPDDCKKDLKIGLKEKTCPLTIMPVVILNNATLIPIPDALVRVVLTSSKAGTSITTLDKPKYTNENGTAFFKTPMNGEYVVGVTVDGFDPIEVPKNVMCDTDNCAGCAPVVTIHTPPTYCPDKSLKLIIMDCQTNDRLAEASVVTTIDSVTRGEVDGGSFVTSETGEILIPITENGIYNTIITMDGYETMRNSFEVSITMDDCDTFDPVDIIPLCPPTKPGCTEVSLSWPNEEDLDLEAHRVNIKNKNDTCSTKPACCTGRCKKEECSGVTPTIDTDTGLEGTETITYCNTSDYSNMIYVSDPSGEGNILPNSGARIVITNGDQEEIIRIDSTNQPENSKFWLAGCLTTGDTSFHFIELHKFLENKPDLEDPLYCYDRASIDKKIREDTTLESAKIIVNIFDAETGEPVSGAIVEASTVKESITRVSKDGTANIKVTKNGEYNIEASAKGYVSEKSSTTLDCSKDDKCENIVTFSLLPAGKTDKIEIVLNWGEKASDLDLHTMQVNKESPGAGCETYFNKMSSCENTKLDGNKVNGGSDGGEKITISDLEDNLKWTYMIFVKDNSADTDELEISEAHIGISDGVKSLSKTLPKFTSKTPSGANFWFVGCLRVVGESYEFAAVDTLSRDSPYVTQKLFCDNLFKKNPQAGQAQKEEFCEDITMKVRLQTEQETAFSSAFDGCGATCTNVQIISVSSDEQKTIFEGAPDGDTISVPINSNGKYLVKLEGDDYIDTEMVFDVKCDITKCRSCRPSFVLPVSPILDVDEAKIMLSWANLPNTLQIFSYERGCAEKNTAYVGVGAPINGNGLSDLVPSWQECSQLCKDTDGCAHWTWISDKFRNSLLANICSMKKETGDIKKVPGVVSGAAGCEDISPPVVKVSTVSTISLSGISQSMPGKVGMIFVENLSKVPKFSSDSHVRVTITDGATVSKNQMDLSNYGGENFWIAGCYKLDDNGVINFSPEASFLNSRPDEEVPDYCLRFYDA